MRIEREVVDRILSVAGEDDGVRAVVRTDLLPVREYLHTCNFCFIVNDVERYDGDVFESCLGERILLFRADRNYPGMFPNTKAHLMVFRDGMTIVIHAMDRDTFRSRYIGDAHDREDVWNGSTFQVLLDKDHALPAVERLEEKQTVFSERPSREDFSGACNEFWWVLKTFAEYALREELPAAMYYLNVAVRDLLNRMLRWHIYLRADRPVDMGILDSNMEKLLEKELYLLYRKTYPDADFAHIREAYDAVVELWRRAGSAVAERCGFKYPRDIEENMLGFIRNLGGHKQASLSGKAQRPNKRR